jgi:hypothetical protein
MRKLAEEVGVDFFDRQTCGVLMGIWWGFGAYGDFKWEFYGGLMGVACFLFFLLWGCSWWFSEDLMWFHSCSWWFSGIYYSGYDYITAKMLLSWGYNRFVNGIC